MKWVRADDPSYPTLLDVSWLASDALGQVAVFSTGGNAPIPAFALSWYSEDTDVEERLLKLPTLGKAVDQHYPKAATFGPLAERGLWVFDWTNPIASNFVDGNYRCVARPSIPLTIASLNPDLRQIAGTIAFSKLRFMETLCLPGEG